MLTIITGTPGAGKSLYTVWEECRKVPGSTIEATNGEAVPRRLLTNIKDLCIEHQLIDAKALETWHEWALPGDVIVFDEVQEVWRPRALGQKVPECIAALETHRHRGVDIILITQHPMLVDPNIRRLCNRHLHLRRLAKTVAYVYEWDHCSNPGMTKTALQSKVWFHPKKAYSLYKSAQLHTKPTARIPRLAYVGVLALAGLVYMVPTAYGRITERFKPPQEANAETTGKPAKQQANETPPQAGLPAPAASSPIAQEGKTAQAAVSRPMGCISMGDRCSCFDPSGALMTLPLDVCREGSHRVGFVMAGQASLH